MAYIGAGITRFNTADELTVTGDAQIDTTTLVVDSTNNRVGIGTSAPAKPLTVVGGDFSTVLLDTANASHATQILFQANSAANSGADIQMSDAGGLKIRTLAVEPLSFHTAASAGTSTERMRIDTSGNVAIGGTNTSYGKLSVRGGFVYINEDNANTNQIYIRSDLGGDPAIQVATSHALKLFTSNQERMRIDSSGNVGIGISAPSAGLHIDNPNNGAITAILDTDNSAVKMVFRNNTETGNNVQIGADGSNLVSLTNGSERLRIDSSGRVMIGTTTEGFADYADTLTVADTDHAGITIRSGASSSGSLYFSDATSGSGEYDGYVNYSHSAQKLTVGTAAATRMTITSAGRVGIGTSSPIANLEIEDGGTSNTILTKITADDQNPYALMIGNDTYSATDTNAFGFVQRNDGTAYIYNAGGLRAAFHNVSGGVLSLEGGVVLGAGAANSTTANTLDDYEEGTWTPSFENTIHPNPTVTYTSQIGTYTKVGNRVHWTATIRWSAFTANGSGYVKLVGFPFTSVSTTAFSQGANVFGYANGIGGSDSLQGAYIDPSTNFFYLNTSANPTAELQPSNVGSAGIFFLGGCVQVS